MARPKGVPNKLTAGARHAIFEVFDKIGGVQGFADWAIDNKQEFYKLWGKSIPQVMTGDPEKPIQHVVKWSE